MSKVEKELTDEEILEWATKDFVIAEISSTSLQSVRSNSQAEPLTEYGIAPGGITITGSHNDSAMTYTMEGYFPLQITRHANDGERKIGYIAGVNSDGSFQLYILGSGTFNMQPTHRVFTSGAYYITGDTRLLPPSMDTYMPEHASDFGDFNWSDTGRPARNARTSWAVKRGAQTYVTLNEAFEFQPTWESAPIGTEFCIAFCGVKGNDYVIDDGVRTITLTNDENTTLKIGESLNCDYWQRSQAGFYYGDKNIGGDLFDLFSSMTLSTVSGVANMPCSVAFSIKGVSGTVGSRNIVQNNLYPSFYGSFAFNYTPYNLILTYDLDAAKNYVATGELPDDAFIYPFDVDNIPVNTDGGTGADDSDGTQDTVDTGDTTWEDTDDQSPSAPGQNGQSLTNNNLYWLTSQQLKSFLDWFWDEATDVTDPSELFEKIQGLYENLSEAIVAVRYMPVRPEWIGGVSTDSKIIVGMLEKAEQCRVINKVVPDIQTIGSIDISELAKDNKTWDGFLNYSPYCQMSLYLPFHGFIDLDADLIMNSKLTIKAAYDILTGTIQYFIYRTARGANNLNLVNTVVAKMATDIPISLQTKTQRDSAIFQNVSSAAGNLIGAGASLATGNPIGMVMSTANIAASQPMGAPLTLKGTISENGAYYDSALCAIYVKRPGINIPSNYDRKVGNPCNVAMELSRVHGFVKCENPFISFSAVTSDNSLGFPPPKPTKDEIDTIYNALSEGVILP